MPIRVPTIRSRRMSWFFMWLISWPVTPSSSSRFISASRPVVKVIDALSGLTPVAKALGSTARAKPQQPSQAETTATEMTAAANLKWLQAINLASSAPEQLVQSVYFPRNRRP